MGAKSQRVLLVDDSEDDRALFRLAFNRARPSMELLNPVNSGDAAIFYLTGTEQFTDRAQHPYPEVLVLDLKMPGKSGFEVLDWLRQQPNRPLTIILSGSDRREDMDKAMSLGADYYQVKPANFVDWVDAVKAMAEFCRKRSEGDRPAQ